ncbi:MMPL family transporter [Ureibacillus thermosphaericus]
MSFFPNDQGTPGIYVFHKSDGEITVEEVGEIIDGIKEADIEGIETIADVTKLAPQALSAFISEDKTTMIVPMNLKNGLGSSDYAEINDKTTEVGTKISEDLGVDFYITGPAGISDDIVRICRLQTFICNNHHYFGFINCHLLFSSTCSYTAFGSGSRV